MANYNIYFSPTGGTKKVADILAGNLAGEFNEIDLCKDIEPLKLGAEDICLVSVPSYGGRVPAVAAERIKKIDGCGARAVLNCVYGNREWDDTLTELQDVLESAGFTCVAAVAAVAEHSIFRQYAAGRPDSEDAAQLSDFAAQIQVKLDSGETGMAELAGSHGTYKEYNGTPFRPEGDERCAGCGLCVQECPVGAIDGANPASTDKEKCISCMRCISLCPNHARDFDPEKMRTIGESKAEALGGHKNNYLFI